MKFRRDEGGKKEKNALMVDSSVYLDGLIRESSAASSADEVCNHDDDNETCQGGADCDRDDIVDFALAVVLCSEERRLDQSSKSRTKRAKCSKKCRAKQSRREGRAKVARGSYEMLLSIRSWAISE